MKEPDLKERIDRIEKLLLDLALHKHRCQYVYIEDLKRALIRRGIYNEKDLRLKAMKIKWKPKKVKK